MYAGMSCRMVLTDLEFFLQVFSRFFQVKMTFLPVREHGNSITFHKYFDITTQAKRTLFSFIYCISTVESLRTETHYEPSRADFLC